MVIEIGGKRKKTAGEKKYKEQSLVEWSSQPMEKRQKDNEGFWREEAKWFNPNTKK